MCVFNGNCLKNYRTIGDFHSDFLAELKVSVLVEKKNQKNKQFVLEIKSATLFIITLSEIHAIFTEM